MLIDWLNGHFIFFIVFVVLSAIIKIVAALFFYRRTAGFTDLLFLLFKWHNRSEIEIADEERTVRFMKILNFLSVLFYFSLLCLAGVYMITALF